MRLPSQSWSFRWTPVIVALIGGLWAAYYVLETRVATADDPDTFLFISYLVWPLVAAAFAVVVRSLCDAKSGSLVSGVDKKSFGLNDPRRILLVASLPVYGVAIIYGGFLISSLLYAFLMVRFLGVRNPFVLAGMVVCVTAIVWLGFSYLLGVPIPLWPAGLRG